MNPRQLRENLKPVNRHSTTSETSSERDEIPDHRVKVEVPSETSTDSQAENKKSIYGQKYRYLERLIDGDFKTEDLDKDIPIADSWSGKLKESF